MGLQQCGLNLNHTNQEMQPHGTLGFACAGYSASFNPDNKNAIPWHWHDEMEIVHVLSGEIKFYVPTKVYSLIQGDCIILNARILHQVIMSTECKINSVVFHQSLLGDKESIFARKYLAPLTQCRSFDVIQIDPNTDKAVIENFNRAFSALESDLLGYEFVVRENLSHICLKLYKHYENEIIVGVTEPSLDNQRILKMIDFIHCNYSNDIDLKEIAKTVDISERECLRCFQRTIGISPIQYLIKHRVMTGANLLQTMPSISISEIAGMCGFDSASNFSKLFKRFYNASPREYRSKSDCG